MLMMAAAALTTLGCGDVVAPPVAATCDAPICATEISPGPCERAACVDDQCTAVADSARNGQACGAGGSTDLCLGSQTCDEGQCVQSAPVDCSQTAVAACLVAACDPLSGQCQTQPAPDGADCTDGDVCTAGDTCTGGQCSGAPRDCSGLDGPCVVGQCSLESGECAAVPDVGATCDSDDVCVPVASCDDTGTCAGPLDPALPGCQCKTNTHCDDGLSCTLDICSDDGQCTHVQVAETCLVNGVCAAADEVSATDACLLCLPQKSALSWSVRACVDEDRCTTDACDSESGCVYTVQPGATCNDDNGCTEGDVCGDDGTCAGTAKTCEDSLACSTDSCVPETGQCLFDVSGCPCADASVCEDGNVCTQDLCDPASNTCAPVPATEPCDDGNPCTEGDLCAGGQCGLGQPKGCDDGIECTLDACDADTGSCVHDADWCPFVLGRPHVQVLVGGSSAGGDSTVNAGAVSLPISGASANTDGTIEVRPLMVRKGGSE
ncbi:MAG: hypothetical protein ACI9WU_005058 [Myxococcota bacterium]|jgi:hypothetical protein